MARTELQTQAGAVRAWTSFVERGDDAGDLVRPEILPAGPARRPRSGRRHRGAAGRRGRDRGVLAGLAAPDRRRAGRGRAASYRRGRRPRRRGHRRRDPDPLDVRRPGDAPQGRDRQLRGRRALGRRVGRHQRPRPRQPDRPARDGLQRRALRLDRAQLGVLGGAGARPGHRRPARRHRPVDDLGPHPPDRAGDRPGDGPADRDRDAGLAPPARRGSTRPPSRAW